MRGSTDVWPSPSRDNSPMRRAIPFLAALVCLGMAPTVASSHDLSLSEAKGKIAADYERQAPFYGGHDSDAREQLLIGHCKPQRERFGGRRHTHGWTCRALGLMDNSTGPDEFGQIFYG